MFFTSMSSTLLPLLMRLWELLGDFPARRALAGTTAICRIKGAIAVDVYQLHGGALAIHHVDEGAVLALFIHCKLDSQLSTFGSTSEPFAGTCEYTAKMLLPS